MPPEHPPLRGNIRSLNFEDDLKQLCKIFGNVAEEVYDALEWELMCADTLASYPAILDDEEGCVIRAITSKPEMRAPQLTLLFGVKIDEGVERTVHIGLQSNPPPVDTAREL